MANISVGQRLAGEVSMKWCNVFQVERSDEVYYSSDMHVST